MTRRPASAIGSPSTTGLHEPIVGQDDVRGPAVDDGTSLLGGIQQRLAGDRVAHGQRTGQVREQLLEGEALRLRHGRIDGLVVAHVPGDRVATRGDQHVVEADGAGVVAAPWREPLAADDVRELDGRLEHVHRQARSGEDGGAPRATDPAPHHHHVARG